MRNIFILGAGGREHALLWKISQNKTIEKIFYAAPCQDGVINPAMAEMAEYVNLDICNPDLVVQFCIHHHIDFVIIGPEGPIESGVSDALRKNNILCFGPSKLAGQLESSKSFTKDICKKLNVPTARYITCNHLDDALKALDEFQLPIVIKADGLAAGKGVVIAEDLLHATQTIHEMFSGLFGTASQKIVLEEFLTGIEASFFVLCDGEAIIPLASAQDHKRAFDGDTGPNTGGMGAYSPAHIMNDLVIEKTLDKIIKPVVSYMKQENMPFQGVLYAGLMIENDEPYLIEFNARFGDPECQVLMQRLQSDLLELLVGSSTSFVGITMPLWHDDYAITIVMASDGYPENPKKGCEINLPQNTQDSYIFHAGTLGKNGKIYANGGRVLNITAMAKDLKTAQAQAYNMIKDIDFKDGFYRTDIGDKGL